MNKLILRKSFQKTVLASLAMLPALANTAPGLLEDVPLNTGTQVQPNVMLLVDDSGSMNWEILRTSQAQAAYPSYWDSGNIDLTPTPSDEREMLESCAGYNVTFYNPNVTYTPWSGVDQAGNAFTDMPVTAARIDPYSTDVTVRSPSTTVSDRQNGVINLATLTDGSGVPGYVPWTDDGDGIYQVGECGDVDTNSSGNAADEMNAIFVPVASMTAEQQQNFANWFSYYRKREYVAKKALSNIIDNSTFRMGLASLWNNASWYTSTRPGTMIRDVDDITPYDATDAIALAQHTQAAANKATLLNNLFNINSASTTPLRTTLNNAGLYFEEGSSPNSSFLGFSPVHSGTDGGTVATTTPILNAANGGSCQQNFAVMFSDGFWNRSFSGVGNADGDNDSTWDGSHFADTYSNTLADIAMHYYESDLSSTLANDVDASDIHGPLDSDGEYRTRDEQHLTTYTVAFGLNGTLSNNPNQSDTSFAWPQIISNGSTTIDDMRHAAWNGRGEYLSAANSSELIDTLNAVFEDIQDRTGSAASSSFNAASVGSDTLIYRSIYNTSNWWGDVRAYAFDTAGNIDFSTEVWSASEELSGFLGASSTAYLSRNIVTYNGSQGIPFEFPSSYSSLTSSTLSLGQINSLMANAPYALTTTVASEITANQAYGENVVNFLKGDNSITGFRVRNNFLGAFVHSAPIYIGTPSEPYGDSIEPDTIGTNQAYSVFQTNNANRTPMLAVGGNDGMLHIFNASAGSQGGEEIFAYIPSSDLLENEIGDLTEPNYSHQAFVDGQLVSGDVFIGNEWRTYLVGGLRSGGKGVFVLDVTDPSALETADDSISNASSIVVGEFTHPDLGYIYNRPQIAQLSDGQWAAIFANGYNNNGDGEAKLFILLLENLGDSDPNNDYIMIETSSGSIVGGDCLNLASDCNGLSDPTLVDLDSNGKVDRVYAGDLFGNLWAFDLSSSNSAEWGIANSLGDPLFHACRSASTSCNVADRQPITSKPIVRRHPSRRLSSTSPNLLVFFGTGQYLAYGDTTNTDLQSFYGVWDAGSSYPNLTRNNLTEQTITQISTERRNLSENSVIYSESGTQNFGWYIDLTTGPLDGERMVVTPLVRGSIVFFITTVPSTDICGGGGYSYIMAADAIDGSQPAFTVFDLNGDGEFDDTTVGGVVSAEIATGLDILSGNPDKLIVSKDSAGVDQASSTSVRSSIAIPSGRTSWSIIR